MELQARPSTMSKVVWPAGSRFTVDLGKMSMDQGAFTFKLIMQAYQKNKSLELTLGRLVSLFLNYWGVAIFVDVIILYEACL